MAEGRSILPTRLPGLVPPKEEFPFRCKLGGQIMETFAPSGAYVRAKPKHPTNQRVGPGNPGGEFAGDEIESYASQREWLFLFQFTQPANNVLWSQPVVRAVRLHCGNSTIFINGRHDGNTRGFRVDSKYKATRPGEILLQLL